MNKICLNQLFQGGTVVLQAGLDHPNAFQGIILIAPAVVPNPESATWFKVWYHKEGFILHSIKVWSESL